MVSESLVQTTSDLGTEKMIKRLELCPEDSRVSVLISVDL